MSSAGDDLEQQRRRPGPPFVLALLVLPAIAAVALWAAVLTFSGDWPPAVAWTITLGALAAPPAGTVAISRRRGAPTGTAAALAAGSVGMTFVLLWAFVLLAFVGCDAPGGDDPCVR